ncbi:hypothetical protein AVEN_122962-1, partial [Araneus ventricosus]
MELKKVKECVCEYLYHLLNSNIEICVCRSAALSPHLLPVLSDKRETDANAFWSTHEGGGVITVPLSTRRLSHWVGPMKMTITGWFMLIW